MLESARLMEQYEFDALIHGKEQSLNRSKNEEVMPRYKFVSLAYYQEQHEDEELEKKAHNLNLRFIMWLSKKS
jgi:hypothetical protein